MRAILAVIVACELVAACAGPSATVVSRTEEAVVLRWDERRTAPGRVAEQALGLCSAHGFNARRAAALADEVDGTVHTTRYDCRPVGRDGPPG